MRSALLGPCLLTIAVLAQGCLLGRSLYYVDDQPATDELRSSSSAGDATADAGEGGTPDRTAKPVTDTDAAAPPAPPPIPPAVGAMDTCNAIATPCVKGGGMQYCVHYVANACASITYLHDAKSFSCGCGGGPECTNAFYGAYTDCQDAAGGCDQLAACCKAADANVQTQCNETLKSYVGQAYGDVSCKSIVNSYRMNKLCP